MKSVINSLRKFWQLLTNPSPEQKEVMGEGRSFYIVLTLILGTVTIIVAANSPRLEARLPLAAFILIMLLHISMHWLSGFSKKNIWLSVAYLVVQSLLGLIAILVSGSPEIALAIFATMIGETIGVFGTSRLSWLSVISFLVLTPLSYILVGGMDTLTNWMSPTTSTMIILIIFMLLFRRQLDTNERVKKLAAELETANQQLTEYATQVESLTLTAERQRMARELHDTLAQGVAGLVLQLEAVKAHLASGRAERAESIIAQALRRARSTLAESRAAIDDLRVAPANMSEAVKVKIERFTQATGIPCELKMDLGDVVLPQNIEGHILRVLSEALANITRHAQATQVWVNLTFENDQFELGIHDNGRGFNPEISPKAGHYGVLGMRERARLIEGELLIDSEIGQGTHIKLFVPVLRES